VKLGGQALGRARARARHRLELGIDTGLEPIDFLEARTGMAGTHRCSERECSNYCGLLSDHGLLPSEIAKACRKRRANASRVRAAFELRVFAPFPTPDDFKTLISPTRPSNAAHAI
jgi:hypothetical protein